MEKYKIIRMHQDGRKPRTMRTGLSIKEARKWCSDPETSSKTAKKACHGSEKLIEKWNKQEKHWFDGFSQY